MSQVVVRRAIVIDGIVQGVGFRPFVHGLARDLGLGGFVRNETSGVRIEVEGPGGLVAEFIDAVAAKPPPLARIARLAVEPSSVRGDESFRIAPSTITQGAVRLPADAATCDDCLREVLDPADRRAGYAFTNCTNCGPRLTIVESAPYDRARTTMAGFTMCDACRAEYDDPRNRRFHAQPNACPACGPKLSIHGDPSTDAVERASRALREGQILGLKGLGGYHLACDAMNERAVRLLRERKHRDEKPFAVMVTDLPAAEALCELSPADRDVLASRERPILLVPRRADCPLAAGVAPENRLLGIMLPYTPLHHLLIRAFGGPLVMTSGNRSDEPIAFEDADAVERLGGIADLLVQHDRPIRLRSDDSVVRVIAGAPLLLRRARGYAPTNVPLPVSCPAPMLALGGHLKTTFALGHRDQAIVSPHIGDLDDARACAAYEDAIAHLERMFEIVPACLVHDLHPTYGSTSYAMERRLPRFGVQHHHAHVASCMVEHGLRGPVVGVAFDGGGFGTDGAWWGGEFLLASLEGFDRAAHLRYVPLPGGDRGIREPWRMALSHMYEAGVADLADRVLPQVAPEARRVIRRLIEKRSHAPLTSSMGRLFDAVAAIAGVRFVASYEGQAASQLEALACAAAPEEAYAFDCSDGVIDAAPVVRAAALDRLAGIARERIARRFHGAVAEMIAGTCDRLRHHSEDVVLSGGVFQNALLVESTLACLAVRGLRAHVHRDFPPNDGGLALGQLAIAAAKGGA